MNNIFPFNDFIRIEYALTEWGTYGNIMYSTLKANKLAAFT